MNPLWNEMKDPPKMLENDTLFLAVTDKLLRSAATCRSFVIRLNKKAATSRSTPKRSAFLKLLP